MTLPIHQNALSLGSMLMEYRLQSVLGAGGFGITYLAHDTNLQKDVAIKEYLPGAIAVRGSSGSVLPTSSGLEKDYRWGLDRFIQEARTLAKFSHPHIVRVNRFFEANGTGYMVMDYEAGEPLKAWLQRNPFPPEPTLRAMLAPLLEGLEKVHAAGFLHRDIKPDNIFIRKDGGPVLIDFGSARQAVSGATQTLTTIVSPGYAPFEQYTTSAEQGPWSDIYSLSGVLYFAVTGQSPPDAITRMKSDALSQGLGGARLRYSGPLVDAIGWGLALEEGSRPRNIAQWREVLFGQRVMVPQSAAVGAQPSQKNAKSTQVSAAGSTGRAAASSAAERIERAAAYAAAQAASRSSLQFEHRSTFPWKSVALAVVAVAMVGVGLRTMRPDPRAHAARPTAVVLSMRQLAGPSVDTPSSATTLQQSQQSFSVVAPPQQQRSPAAEANVAAAASETLSANPQPAPALPSSETSAPAASVESSGADAGSHTILPAERRVEARFRAADPENTGLTREEMARNFPRLATHFDEIDTNHNGRIEASELSRALQHMTSQARDTQ
ncbi:MAG TPA: protein kinase [Burkholderiales bacterium]|nr:protein kinase [Burkholderiales bacterium]